MGNARHSARAVGALLAGLLTAAPAAAETCPAPREIAPQEGTRAFTIQRHLAGMAKPIESAGEVTTGAERLVWQICTPFDIRTEIGPEGVYQAYEGGPLEPIGSPAAQDMVRRLGVADLLRGRFDNLEKSFALDERAADDAGRWRVVLTPHDGALGRVVGEMTVEGCTAIERIAVVRPDEDREEIFFGDALADEPERAACAQSE